MKQQEVLITLVLLGTSVQADAGEIIASMDRLFQISSQSQHSECTAVSIRLGHENVVDQEVFLGTGLAPIEWFPVFVNLNESTSGHEFTGFVSRITDAQDGVLSFRPLLLCDSTIVPFENTSEQEFAFFGGASDLAGYSVDYVRVNFLEIDLDLVDGVNGSFHARFDFIGEPVPEPSSAGLCCAFLTLMSLHRRRIQA